MKLMESKRIVHSILYFVFFLSGATALVYQLVWIRVFGLVFGVSVFAISTVLTAFMSGLALGNLLFGRLVDRYKNPLTLFSFLQFGLGIFALVFPFTFRALESTYLSVHHLFPSSFYVSSLIRFVFSFTFLLIPTTLMGGTMPVMTRYFVKNLGSLGRNVGRLYSVNNLGAFGGCFAAGFLLVHMLGSAETILVAGGVNLFMAILVLVIGRTEPRREVDGLPATEEEQVADQMTYPAHVLKLVLWVFAIEGFTTLSYEIVWARILLGFSFDKSVYFSSTVILSFVFGLSIGSWLVTFLIDRYKNLLALLGWIEISVGLLAIALLPIFSQVGEYLESIRQFYVDSWFIHLGKEYFLFFMVMLLPVILMGATFPIVSKIVTTNIQHFGRRIGFIGALDTVGSILGSFFAGFIFIPFIGVVNAVLLTAGINLIIGFLIFLHHPAMTKNSWIIIGASLLIGAVILLQFAPKKEYFQTWQTTQREDRLCYYKEGVAGTISVPQNLDGEKVLSINGATSGGVSPGDVEVHTLEGYLPYLLADNPRNALLIGLGTGITANCLVHSELDHVDCVEICPEVIQAAEMALGYENNHVVKSNKFTSIIEDGRSFLQITDKKYDIITSSGIHPRLSPNIYTKEFYEICHNRLTDNGAICKWVPTNWLSEREFKMLLKSFVDVFPHSSLWVGNAGQAVIVGKKQPITLNLDDLHKKLNNAAIFQNLSDSYMETPAKLLSKFVGDEEALKKYLVDASANSDNDADIEFSRTVNKGRNPAIIGGLIDLKQHPSDAFLQRSEKLSFDLDEFERHFQAEKWFMIANIINVNGDRLADMYDALHHAVNLDSTNFRYRESLAIIEYKNGNAKNALQQMLQVIELQPEYGPHYEKAGRIYFDNHDFSNAFKCFQQALQLDAELPVSRYFLALLYAADGKLNRSIIELKKVIELYPRFGRAHLDLGIIYFTLDDDKAAKRCFEKCLDIHPDMDEAIKWLERLKGGKQVR
ncbi:MAG: MFS transporter [Calditrichaeota bacterium]|nr:MAG: MFS transporter [Calditrichota bacterium]